MCPCLHIPTTVFILTKQSLCSPLSFQIVFGNPNIGTPLMQVSPTTGIDLPLKILVWQDPFGMVNVSYNDVYFLARRHGLEGLDSNLEVIETALNNFVSAATSA